MRCHTFLTELCEASTITRLNSQYHYHTFLSTTFEHKFQKHKMSVRTFLSRALQLGASEANNYFSQWLCYTCACIGLVVLWISYIGVSGIRSILCGAFSGPPVLCSTLYFLLFISVTGTHLLWGMEAHGWDVWFCQSWMQSPSWSWQPILDTPRCLRHQ